MYVLSFLNRSQKLFNQCDFSSSHAGTLMMHVKSVGCQTTCLGKLIWHLVLWEGDWWLDLKWKYYSAEYTSMSGQYRNIKQHWMTAIWGNFEFHSRNSIPYSFFWKESCVSKKSKKRIIHLACNRICEENLSLWMSASCTNKSNLNMIMMMSMMMMTVMMTTILMMMMMILVQNVYKSGPGDL